MGSRSWGIVRARGAKRASVHQLYIVHIHVSVFVWMFDALFIIKLDVEMFIDFICYLFCFSSHYINVEGVLFFRDRSFQTLLHRPAPLSCWKSKKKANC